MNELSEQKKDFRHNELLVIGLMAMCFGTMAVSVDVLVPVLGLIAEGLEAEIEEAQQSITVLIAFCGAGQLLFGPFSDKNGRNPALMVGGILFLSGILICAFAPNMLILLVGRALQGFGASSYIVVSRAILRDLYSGQKLAAMISMTFAAMGVLTFSGSVLGYLCAHFLGWRAAFGLLAVFASVLIVLFFCFYSETIKLRNPSALQPRIIGRCVLKVLRHPQSLSFMIVQLLVNSAMFGYVISAPRIYIETHEIESILFPFYYGIVTLALIPGQLINQWLLRRFLPDQLVLASLLLLFVLSGVGIACEHFEVLGPALYTAFSFFLVMLVMVVVSNCSALVMDPQGKIAGIASSLLGTVSFVFGSILGALMASFLGNDQQLLYVCLLVIIVAALAMVVCWHWVHSSMEPSAETSESE